MENQTKTGNKIGYEIKEVDETKNEQKTEKTGKMEKQTNTEKLRKLKEDGNFVIKKLTK